MRDRSNRSSDGSDEEEADTTPFLQPSDTSSAANTPPCTLAKLGMMLFALVILAALAGYTGFRHLRAEEIERAMETSTMSYVGRHRRWFASRDDIASIPADSLDAWVDAMWTLKKVPGPQGRIKFGRWYKSYQEFVLSYTHDVEQLQCGTPALFGIYKSLLLAEFEGVTRRLILIKRPWQDWARKVVENITGSKGGPWESVGAPPAGTPFWDWEKDDKEISSNSLDAQDQDMRSMQIGSAVSKRLWKSKQLHPQPKG